MVSGVERVKGSSLDNQAQAIEVLGRLVAVADQGAVFSAPIQAGDYTVITAAEVSVGMGLGFGGGEGPKDEGSGGGGGGGGFSAGRPVATIQIGPDGVRVEPIVDASKIALTFFTVIGAIFITVRGMRRASRALRRAT
jgi:uncharacterized spore protein YtfJ